MHISKEFEANGDKILSQIKTNNLDFGWQVFYLEGDAILSQIETTKLGERERERERERE